MSATVLTEFESIVIATDGGSAGRAALRWVLVHAGDRPVCIELVSAMADEDAETRAEQERLLRAAQQVLQVILPLAEVTLTFASGDPIEALERASGLCDLMVIGSHHASLGHPRRRGIPQRLAELARCPVVVVPGDWLGGRGPVVIGVTADSIPPAVLAFGGREAADMGATLRLAHVWNMPGVGAEDPSQDPGIESIPERQRRALARLDAVATLAEPGIRVDSELRQGAVVASLLEMAADASLLVIGRAQRSIRLRTLFGSVSREVLATSPCPVAVIP